jgi:uncharacterized membrane protein HdeD (DUF308 family)
MTIPHTPRSWIDVRHDLSALRAGWWLFLVVGILLIFFGLTALSSLIAASLATAIVIGILLLLGGLAETFGAFWSRAWSGFLLHLLSGVLSIVVGALFLRAPVGALVALTLLLACLLMVAGLFRISAALTYRFAAWRWSLAIGIIDLILGVMIWMQWPASAMWVIGLFVGISLLFRGSHWIALALALHALRRTDAGPAATPAVA